MKYRGLNKNLQMRVQKYMEYMHGEDKFGYKNGEYILTNLSHTLRKEVLMDIYGKILTENTFLRKFFSHVFLKECALQMKETTFASGDLIFQVNNNKPYRIFNFRLDNNLKKKNNNFKCLSFY